MKTSELTADLRAAGCYIIRHGSSHDIWYSPITKRKTPVPRHGAKEIPIKTELNIRQALGVPRK